MRDYTDKPKIENTLFILQDEFIDSNRNPKVLEKMYFVLDNYIRKLIVKKIRNKIYYDKSFLDEKTLDTIEKLFFYYLENKEFKIQGSFAGYLNLMLLDILYNRSEKEENDHDSLNKLVDNVKNDSNKKEKIDTLNNTSFSTLNNTVLDTEKDLIEKDLYYVRDILELVDKCYDKIKQDKGIKDSLLFVIGINYILNKEREEFINRYYDYVGYDICNFIKKTAYAIFSYLKNNIKE